MSSARVCDLVDGARESGRSNLKLKLIFSGAGWFDFCIAVIAVVESVFVAGLAKRALTVLFSIFFNIFFNCGTVKEDAGFFV